MTTVLGLNDKIPDLSVRQLRFIENRFIRPTIELRFIEKKKCLHVMKKKEKEAFHKFDRVEAFSSLIVSKRLNQSRYSIMKRCFRPTKTHFFPKKIRNTFMVHILTLRQDTVSTLQYLRGEARSAKIIICVGIFVLTYYYYLLL